MEGFWADRVAGLRVYRAPGASIRFVFFGFFAGGWGGGGGPGLLGYLRIHSSWLHSGG